MKLLSMPALQAWPLALALATTALPGVSAWAHGGEDHGEPPDAVTPSTPAAPRASAQTEGFELVAVMRTSPSPLLTIYLDHADTNAPIEGANIEVESGSFKGTAKAVEAGVYALPAPTLAQPGHYPLTITVQTAQGADLLDATLDVQAAEAHDLHADHPAIKAARWPWLAAAAAALIIPIAAWRRMRAKSAPAHESKESA